MPNGTTHHAPPAFQVCFKNNRTVGSLGMWVGDNPLHFVLPVTLCQIILAFIVSRVLYCTLRPLQTPKFICCVLGGVLVGPTFIGRNAALMDTLFPLKQASFLTTMSQVGASYFLFIYALKLDIATSLKAAKRFWRFGVIPFFTTYFVTSILLDLYKPNGDKKQVTGGTVYSIPNVFTVTSFAVVSEALTELNLISTELGQIALTSAMITEIMQWTTITLHFNSQASFVLSLGFLTCSFLFVLSFFFVVRPMAMAVIERTPIGKPVNEIYIIIILLGVLVMSALSDLLGLYFIIGPVLFGLVMPNGPPLATTIIEKSELVIQEFLMPFFFLYIGLNTNFGQIRKNWKVAATFQGILFIGFLTKVISCVIISPTLSMRLKHGLVLGLILNIKGIVELIFFARLRRLQAIDDEVYSQMVLYVVVMTGICIPFVKILYKCRSRVLVAKSIHEGRVRTLQNSPDNSEFNVISCVHTEANVRSMIGLLEACNPSKESPLCAHVIHLTELLGKSTPILLPINMQNRKALSINYPNSNHILRAFENYSRNSNGPVTINSYVNVSPYNNMHEAICNLAQDKLVHFLIIPFHENDQSLCSKTVGSSIRDLNANFQARAQCTVGLLVDRYSRVSTSTTKPLFNVSIFFVGGKDDREALVLGIRMLDRPNTRVTLFSFVIKNPGAVDVKMNEEEEALENMLDESLIDEFKAKQINFDNVVCHEIVVDDCIQVLEAIRGLKNDDYDLVLVGKRHNIGDLTDEEMSNFMDNAKLLGIFGDMLVSTEFCDGRVPVLVLQCGEKKERTCQGSVSSLLMRMETVKK